jgi:capsular polysaccharide biosynthesis protein
MELREAGRRIVRQHWLLIVALVVLGVLVAAIHAHHSPTYTASTRLVLGTDDPKSRTESGAIADTAKAIATSLTQVERALKDAHVPQRNPNDVARNHVFVRALGTSGVVQLAVSDSNPDIAASVANALARRVIRVRTEVTSGQLDQVLSDLSSRVDDLNAKISAVDQKIDGLNVSIAQTGSPSTANALRAQRDEASRQRDFLAQQRSVLESERISVLTTNAQRPKASVISAASIPTHHDSSPLLQETILGALLGLVLGIGVAGLIETFRPTLVGNDSLAREFDTPLLGAIPTDQEEPRARHTLGRIALRLRLAAETEGVHNVGLVAVGPDVELGLLAATLDELANRVSPAARQSFAAAEGFGGRAVSSTEAERAPRAGDASSPSRCRIRPFGLLDGRPDGDTALVLVSPDVAKKEEIDEVSHLLRVAASPLLGLITYERPRERRSSPLAFSFSRSR